VASIDSDGAFGIKARREGEQIIIQALNPEELDFPEGFITKFALSFPLESSENPQTNIPEP